MGTEPVREGAPAKINLCLHVIEQRPDGYHTLDSLVVFAGAGDRVTAEPGTELSLSVSGPESAGLTSEADNLVLRAARMMGVKARLQLWKELPVASGIGGGSADAAASLRALARLTGQPLPDPKQVLALGADVPVCLAGRPARMRGIGEDLSPLPSLPAVWLVLVNPRQAVPTPAVFSGLTCRENAPVPDLPARGWASAAGLADWLQDRTRNDLQGPAIAIAPVIGRVLAVLAADRGCLLARMSGSGATCFGLFATQDSAMAAARALRASEPGWWVCESPLQA